MFSRKTPIPTITHLTLFALLSTSYVYAGERTSEKTCPPASLTPLLTPTEGYAPKWSVEIGLRLAQTAFVGKDQSVDDIIPRFYYEGERFFIRGTEGGFHLWENESFGFDLLTRYRFFDYPEELDDQLNRNTFDSGLRAYWKFNSHSHLAAEILTDPQGRIHGLARVESTFSGERWSATPLFEIRGKSANFNSRYYGLGLDDVHAGIDARVALESRIHLWRNLHLAGSLQARWLDGNTRDSRMVDDSMEYMAYVGIGFSEVPFEGYTHTKKRELKAKPYIRVAQGFGNDSTLAQIFNGDIRTDGASVQMTSLFYGHPLADTLFDLPIETYLTSGIIHHYSSKDQDSATEMAVGVKFFYTIPLPWRVRLGATEGVSYIDSFTYYEKNSLLRDDLKPSRLLNYVDLSIDLNLGDIVKYKPIKDLWLGYGIHHRSGIGGTSPTFGNISGGSNFNTIYLQWSPNF